MIDKGQAQASLGKISAEMGKLDPSMLVTLYEIDVSEIKTDLLLNKNVEIGLDIFRFHNMNNLKGAVLYFQGNSYASIPIMTDGFELSSAGSLPTPTLTIASVEGTDQAFSLLKKAFIELDNLIGAKVTRIRTFAKFLDKSLNDNTDSVGEEEDVNAELPRDVYHVERKSHEDKTSIQFELSSFLDLHNLSLPGRPLLADKCPFTYRGEGCCYEYKSYTSGPTFGNNQENIYGSTGRLPAFAPPIANALNEPIGDKIANYNPLTLGRLTGANKFSGQYNKSLTYESGSVVFLEKNDIKYYFVAKGDTVNNEANVPIFRSPPNSVYWEPDQCSKTLSGCKLRWAIDGGAQKCKVGEPNCDHDDAKNSAQSGFLPFGGFPGTNTRIETRNT